MAFLSDTNRIIFVVSLDIAEYSGVLIIPALYKAVILSATIATYSFGRPGIPCA